MEILKILAQLYISIDIIHGEVNYTDRSLVQSQSAVFVVTVVAVAIIVALIFVVVVVLSKMTG